MNTIKYFISRSIQTFREQGFLVFFKVIIGKILGKNLEFIDFIFRKWTYYFRGSEIGFAMIRDSYRYMEQSDFVSRYHALIVWLDDESKKTVALFIHHIRIFYHNNIVHESEIFTDREKRLQQKSFEFMGKYGVLHPTGYGIFENPEILKHIGTGAILDVGASDGIEAMMFAKFLPNSRKVYAFEPSSYNCNKLRQNISKSEFSDKILPQQIALSQEDGEMELFGSWWAEVSFINLGNNSSPSEKVQVMSIDSFTKQENIERVWLIKWDIEWAEMESIIWGKEVIMRDKPVLIISIYHNGREFFETKPLLESWDLWYRFQVLQWEPGGTWVGVVLICY